MGPRQGSLSWALAHPLVGLRLAKLPGVSRQFGLGLEWEEGEWWFLVRLFCPLGAYGYSFWVQGGQASWVGLV